MPKLFNYLTDYTQNGLWSPVGCPGLLVRERTGASEILGIFISQLRNDQHDQKWKSKI